MKLSEACIEQVQRLRDCFVLEENGMEIVESENVDMQN